MRRCVRDIKAAIERKLLASQISGSTPKAIREASPSCPLSAQARPAFAIPAASLKRASISRKQSVTVNVIFSFAFI
jgi:hypothetical protein